MRRFSTLASVVIGAAVWVAGPQAQAAEGHASASISNGKAIFTQGKGDVPACNSCHGEGGMGNDAMGTPRLAGQISQFIVKQLEDFANDRRQDATMFVMNTNAKGLSPQDRRDVAAYVSTLGPHGDLPPASDLSNLADLKAGGTELGVGYQGKAIVNYGIPERGVPACRSCHDYNGRGVDPVYPMIGGQKFVYLINQLNHWRDGSRANDPMAQMQKVAKSLTDSEIRDIATFLSHASPLTIGNSRTPERHGFMTFDTGSSTVGD